MTTSDALAELERLELTSRATQDDFHDLVVRLYRELEATHAQLDDALHSNQALATEVAELRRKLALVRVTADLESWE